MLSLILCLTLSGNMDLPRREISDSRMKADSRRSDADKRVEATRKLLEGMEADPLAFRLVIAMEQFQRLASSDGKDREIEFTINDEELGKRIEKAMQLLEEFKAAHGVK